MLANLTGVCYWWGWVPTCGFTAILSASALHQWYLPFIPVTDSEITSENLNELRRMGVILVLDDFGTGYASLAYLRRFPIDAIKIDRRFITGVGQDADDTTIVETILRMAVGRRLDVVAEGVETPGQAAILERMGCSQGQGFLSSHPLPPDEASRRIGLDPTPLGLIPG